MSTQELKKIIKYMEMEKHKVTVQWMDRVIAWLDEATEEIISEIDEMKNASTWEFAEEADPCPKCGEAERIEERETTLNGCGSWEYRCEKCGEEWGI